MTRKEKAQKTLTQQREDAALYRVLAWLGAAVLLEIFVLFLNRYAFNYNPIGSEVNFANRLLRVLPTMELIGLLLALCCVIWAMADWKRGKTPGGFRFILAGFFVCLSLVSALLLYFGSNCIPALLVAIPALAALAMIYYLYQREFLLIALCIGLGIIGAWAFRRAGGLHETLLYAYFILAFCLVASICLLARYLQKNQGTWRRGGKQVEFMAADASYPTVFGSGLLVALALLGTLFLGAAFAYYALVGLVVWLFIMAVYFTSKLM